MIVVGALAWYAETEQTLERCARSLGGVCDILVALGGRWQGFPAMPLDDADAQARAIKRGADQADISFCAVSWTREPFRSQVAKRAELMLAARTLGDWVFVIDADEYVATANTDELETTLAATHADVATVAGIRVPITASSVRRPWRRIYRASTGVTVETAHNGEEALLMARSFQYDAVLADIRLPDMSGYDCFCQIREGQRDLPVILMTGFGYDPGHSIVKARQQGLKSVLYKPFRVDQLLDEVETAVNHQGAVIVNQGEAAGTTVPAKEPAAS